MTEISMNFNVYPLVVGQFNKYTFDGWEEAGGTIKLWPEFKSEEYSRDDLFWTSSNPWVAYVEQSGVVHAITVGITDICAQLPDGSSAVCRIQVIDNAGRITPAQAVLNTNHLVLGRLQGAALHPVIFPKDYFENGMLDKEFTWTSSNPNVVTVDHRGRVYGKNCGTATITGVSNDVMRVVSCQVDVVRKSDEEMYINPLEDMEGGSITLQMQEKQKLELPEEVRRQPVCWCSEDASLVGVDEHGTITAYRSGTALVWATFINGGYRVRYEIHVAEQPEHAVTGICLNKTEVKLAAGEQTDIYAAVFPAVLLEKQLVWESSNEEVLKIVRQHINLSGLDEIIVEGVQEGTAVIRGSLEGKEVSCHVEVLPEQVAVRSIELPAEAALELEESRKLQPVLNPDATDRDIVWLCDSRKLVTVDKDGIIKGYNGGTAHVYAIAENSLEDGDMKELKQLMELRSLLDSPEALQKLEGLLARCVYAVCTVHVDADRPYLSNFHVPEETIAASSVCLLWNRKSLADAEDFKYYEIYQDGEKIIKHRRQLGHTVRGLQADTEYVFDIRAMDCNGRELKRCSLTVRTKPEPAAVLDVTKEPYCAAGNGIALDTYAIQRAIDDCPEGGTVLLPEGFVFHSGALFLKSHMTFQVEGILLGSQNPEDYPPVVCRWEGFRKLRLTEENQKAEVPVFENNVYSHSSLLNVGVYDEGLPGKLSPVHTEDVCICGSGMINANGFMLAYNEGPCWYTLRKGLSLPQSPKRDQNVRGRVIAIYNARRVYVSDLTVAYGPAWTIQAVFCDEVTFDTLKVISKGNGWTGVSEGMLVLNGDGIDPDSSTNVNISCCYFTVGDDAVAIKSGRNRQGNELAKPSAHIRVTDCVCVDAKGAFCIGSEQAGGVHDVLFQNLYVRNLTNFGLWIKSAPSRGGLVEDVYFRDCILKQTGGAMQIEYNHGGDEDPASQLPRTRRVAFENIYVEGRNKFGLRLIGMPGSPIEDVLLKSIFYEKFEAYKDRKFYISECKDIQIDQANPPKGYSWEKD